MSVPLLWYLSVLESGSWNRFREAQAASRAMCGKAPILVARDLAAVGHIELNRDTLNWCVCDPALVELPSKPGTQRARGILCGARSPEFHLRTIELVHDMDGTWDDRVVGEDVIWRLLVDMPDRETLEWLAEELKIPLIVDAARRLSQCLPSLDALLRVCDLDVAPVAPDLWRPSETAVLSGKRWQWDSVKTADQPGVYRQRWLPSVRYWWRGETEVRHTPREVAIYTQFHQLLQYDARRWTVTFPAEARPPDLHLRTLALCSGQLPKRVGSGELQLSNVPPDVAVAVVQSLRQEGVVAHA